MSALLRQPEALHTDASGRKNGAANGPLKGQRRRWKHRLRYMCLSSDEGLAVSEEHDIQGLDEQFHPCPSMAMNRTRSNRLVNS
jgi:hypothetical protein